MPSSWVSRYSIFSRSRRTGRIHDVTSSYTAKDPLLDRQRLDPQSGMMGWHGDLAMVQANHPMARHELLAVIAGCRTTRLMPTSLVEGIGDLFFGTC